MFHVHGIHGRMFSGTLEQLQRQPLVGGVARLRRTAPLLAEADPPVPAATGGSRGGRPSTPLVSVAPTRMRSWSRRRPKPCCRGG